MFAPTTRVDHLPSSAVLTDTAVGAPRIRAGNAASITAARAALSYRLRRAIPLLVTTIAIFCISYLGRRIMVDAAATPAESLQFTEKTIAAHRAAIESADNQADIVAFLADMPTLVAVKDYILQAIEHNTWLMVRIQSLSDTDTRITLSLAVASIADQLHKVVTMLESASAAVAQQFNASLSALWGTYLSAVTKKNSAILGAAPASSAQHRQRSQTLLKQIGHDYRSNETSILPACTAAREQMLSTRLELFARYKKNVASAIGDLEYFPEVVDIGRGCVALSEAFKVLNTVNKIDLAKLTQGDRVQRVDNIAGAARKPLKTDL